MRVFLDANILFTAAISPVGAARRALHARHQAKWVFVASPYVIEEARGNLASKIGSTAGLDEILTMIELGPDAFEPAWPELRAKDQPVLASALASQCDILATGDKRDFGLWLDKKDTLAGIKVRSIASVFKEMLEI